MDLRMVKTKQQIKKAFLTLREQFMPEKITVKDICDIAMINKTTFYHHYADSAELSNEIADHAVASIISDFPEKDKIFDDPRSYVIGFMQAMERQSENLKIIFRGTQETLCNKLEEQLKKFYDNKSSSFDDKLKLSFAIGGFIRIVKEYVFSSKNYNRDNLVNSTIHMVETLFNGLAASKI